MKRAKPIIAIDGPAGSGKSTAAKGIAKRLQFQHIDTGALYRAVALCALEANVNLENEEEVIHSIKDYSIEFRSIRGETRLYLNNRDISQEIRTEKLSSIASKISTYKKVRTALLDLQRSHSKTGACVLDGRDIATVIFPDAEVKIFLNASIEERAKRRVKEHTSDSFSKKVHMEEVIKQILERDERDSKRVLAPLKKAEGAIEIDTTKLQAGEVLEKIEKVVHEWMESQKNAEKDL